MKNLLAAVVFLSLAYTAPAQVEVARFEGAPQSRQQVMVGNVDLDGDGFSDVIVGAHRSNTAAPSGGSVYAFSGADGSVIWQIDHATPDAWFGYSLALGGTTFSANGDLFVGAPQLPFLGIRPGAVYVVDRSDGSVVTLIWGNQHDSYFGWSVAGADLDKTGKVWPVIGAPYEDAPSGDVDAGSMTYFLNGIRTMEYGFGPGSWCGYALASGDHNGDGHLDVMVGHPGYSGAGGTNTGMARLYWSGGSFATILHIGGVNTGSGDQMGRSVGTVAGPNGYDNFLLGVPFNDEGGTNAGKVGMYSFFWTVWRGESPGEQFGTAVAGVGDVDGDGVEDWVGTGSEQLNSFIGYARCISGQTGLDVFRVHGEVPYDLFGVSAAGLGDLNGDGVPEIGVGAQTPDLSGRVQAFSPCGLLVSYCTAGISSSGCQPVLTTTGQPSATNPAGFAVFALPVEGGKDGLFYYGENGRQAAPWGNGTSYQCVVPPVRRAGLLMGSGTAGSCSGSFSQDLNAHWSANPTTAPVVGSTVQLQCWYRDPFNTSNQTTSLTDAIEFILCP